MPSPSFYGSTLVVQTAEGTQEYRLQQAVNGQEWYSFVSNLAKAIQALQAMGKDKEWLMNHLNNGTIFEIQADGKRYVANLGDLTAIVETKPRSGGGRKSQKVVITL